MNDNLFFLCESQDRRLTCRDIDLILIREVRDHCLRICRDKNILEWMNEVYEKILSFIQQLLGKRRIVQSDRDHLCRLKQAFFDVAAMIGSEGARNV